MASVAAPDPSLLKAQADALCREGQYARAAAAYRAHLALLPPDPAPALANLSLCALRAGDAPAAVRAAELALARRPRWAKGHVRAASAHAAVGDHAAAAAAYARALELDPGLAADLAPARAELAKAATQAARRALCCGHEGAVTCLAALPASRGDDKAAPASPPTTLLASGGADGSLRLWCPATGACLGKTPAAHAGRVISLAHDASAGLLASCSQDGSLAVWRLDSSAGAPRPALALAARLTVPGAAPAPVPVRACFLHDTGQLAGSWSDGAVRVWRDLAAPPRLTLPGPGPGAPAGLTASPDGALLAAVGEARCRVWEAKSGALRADVAPESGQATLCAFLSPLAAAGGCGANAPATQTLVTGHWNGERREGRLMAWDVARGGAGWVGGALTGPLATRDDLAAAPVALRRLGRGFALLTSDGLLRAAEAGELAEMVEVGEARGGGAAGGAVAGHAWRVEAAATARGARAALATCPAGLRAAVVDDAGTLHVFDGAGAGAGPGLAAGAVPRTLVWLAEDAVATGSADGTISVWRV
ncbi:hypothetical protein ACKKBG_A11200 [Auxenochlorella protothecoides x Auxenochlorella symbiontica]